MTLPTRLTYTLCTIGKLPVRIDLSWAVLSGLLIAALGSLYSHYISLVDATTLAIGAVVLLIISVLIHEIGHAIAAHKVGVSVGAITLFSFGGATELGSDPRSATEEFWIGLSGPLASLFMTGLFAVVWWYAPGGVVELLLFQLLLTNLLIAVINLLPSYPLDGGRVVRATLWFLLDDEARATALSIAFGVACGWAIVLIGVAYIGTNQDWLSGIWVVFLGGFVIQSTRRSYRQFKLRRELSRVQVVDLMRPAYKAVAPDLRLDVFAANYTTCGELELPVILEAHADQPRQLLGMIGLRHLQRFHLHQWAHVPVSEAMTPLWQLTSLQPHASLHEALRTIRHSDADLIPVVEGDELCGVLRQSDLVSYINSLPRW